jgi:hypothetical protein
MTAHFEKKAFRIDLANLLNRLYICNTIILSIGDYHAVSEDIAKIPCRYTASNP